jgi:hypothetical protein
LPKDPDDHSLESSAAYNSLKTADFSLAAEDDTATTKTNLNSSCRMTISRFDDQLQGAHTTSTLNPFRPPEILTLEIFDLICTQMKYIVGLSHKALVQSTMHTMVNNAKSTENLDRVDEFYCSLWSTPDDDGDESERRRGRSPGRLVRAASMDNRKQAHSLSKLRNSTAQPNGIAAIDDGNQLSSQDTEQINDSNASSSKKASMFMERRSRSSSTGKRMMNSSNSTTNGTSLLSKSLHSASRERLSRSRGGVGYDSSGRETPNSARLSKQDELFFKQLETLKSLPPDLYYRIAQNKLPIHGVWMTTTPLQSMPFQQEDMLGVVADTLNLSDNKKLEWELDLMREYDEKKMDRLERFLLSKRNYTISQSIVVNYKSKGLKASTKSSTTANPVKIDPFYYKDRGRQPIHSIN